jgi:RNA polymerase sigma factor (sigma-70 family)
MEAIQAGAKDSAAADKPDVAELYRRHIASAAGLAFLLTRDASIAEDLAQDAFVRVVGRFRHLRRPEAFAPYLRRTVVNLCRAHFRRLRIERDVLRRESAGRSVADPREMGERDDLARALASLPYRQRAAVVLRFYEDLSEGQVGEILRCSNRAVNALVSRAMAALRRELEGEER